MIIKTQKQFNEIPEGTILTVVEAGDCWDDPGESFNCIKTGDILIQLGEFYRFSERDEKGFEFVVIEKPDRCPDECLQDLATRCSECCGE